MTLGLSWEDQYFGNTDFFLRMCAILSFISFFFVTILSVFKFFFFFLMHCLFIWFHCVSVAAFGIS